jgi:predicted metal-dependent phosphoesterase TrpH
MGNQVDLHLHTTASDGRLSPQEIVARAANTGLEIIAITDHDILDGILPALTAAKKFPQLTVIPGVEISTDFELGDVHILGYFIDHTDSRLETSLKEMRQARLERAHGMIEKLASMDMPLEWDRVREVAGDGSVGRPHIARAMLEKGYIVTTDEAFHKYIGRGGPAYVERIKMSPEEAVKLILQSSGLPVLAHPLTIPEPEELIKKLKEVGLIGLEAYYNGFPPEFVNRVLELANRHDLIATGGSDYHGFNGHEEVDLGHAAVPLKAAQNLIALAKKRGLKGANLKER